MLELKTSGCKRGLLHFTGWIDHWCIVLLASGVYFNGLARDGLGDVVGLRFWRMAWKLAGSLRCLGLVMVRY